MRVVVVCVGKVRAPFADDVAHYERLVGRLARLETVELPEGRGEPGQAIAAEAEAIARRIPERSFVAALDRGGNQLSSRELAAWVERRRQEGRDLCLVIGGAFGLSGALTARADERLSLGPLTLPHQLARVVLLEQLFRAHKILAREPYHY